MYNGEILSKKTIVQYLIRIVRRGTWPRKYRICKIIRYPRVYIKWKHFFVFRAIDYFHFFCVVFRSIANCFFFLFSIIFFLASILMCIWFLAVNGQWSSCCCCLGSWRICCCCCCCLGTLKSNFSRIGFCSNS